MSAKRTYRDINFVFTYNNYTEEDVERICQLAILGDKVRYIAYGREVAPTTGTIHLQGFLQMKERQTISGVRRITGIPYVRFMEGNFEQNDDYCSKVSHLHEVGKRVGSGRGKRTDLQDFWELVKSGMSDLELMEADFKTYSRCMKSVDRYRSLNKPTRNGQTSLEVFLFYGQPGTGKTELALSQFEDSYRLPIGRGFWLTPSAVGKKHIVIDEFKSNIGLSDLLQILDKYPIEVERKGDHLWWCPDTIIITTNRSPWDWYNYNDRDFEREALFRRIDYCYKFDKNTDKIPQPKEIIGWRENPSVFKNPITVSMGLMTGDFVSISTRNVNNL